MIDIFDFLGSKIDVNQEITKLNKNVKIKKKLIK